MKIGTFTLPLYNNYGGIVQAFALTTVLKNMGHDVLLIDQEFRNTPKWKYPLTLIKRLFYKYFKGQHDLEVFFEIKRNRDRKIVNQNIEAFVAKYFKKTKFFGSPSELKIGIKNYAFDAVIVGSDQVWRPKYTFSVASYFLDFVEGSTKRIAYAPSFGTDQWEFNPVETASCKDLIHKFTSISVREDSAVQLCSKHFGIDSTHVLDPTMLLDVSDYRKLYDYTLEKKSGLLVYVLDDSSDKQKTVDMIAQSYSLIPFKTNVDTDNFKVPASLRIAPPVENWLKSFDDAEFVITDSFHAVVFSILYNKPFIVYGNKSRGMARFASLLKLFRLENRLITSFEELTSDILKGEIVWDDVNAILKEQRMKAIDFLKGSL